MTPTLRPYQQRALAILRANVRRRPLLVIPCGGGKSVILAALISETKAAGGHCLFLAHRRELVAQAKEHLARWDVETGRGSATKVRSVQSLSQSSNNNLPKADLVIFDECHHICSESWARIANHYKLTGTAIIGATATPFRLDGRPLGDQFSCRVEPTTTRELCDLGYLVEPTVLAPRGTPGPDLTGVKIVGGDYDRGSLSERMMSRLGGDLIGNVVAHWLEHARLAGGGWMKSIGFATSVAHSHALVERFRKAGARAAHVDGATPKLERERALRDLAGGKIDILWNVELFSEGFDLPNLACCIVARPTASLAWHRQCIGRIMRPAPGKAAYGCLLLDHAANVARHGHATDRVIVGQDGRAQVVRSERWAAVDLQSENAAPKAVRIPVELPGGLVIATAGKTGRLTSARCLDSKILAREARMREAIHSFHLRNRAQPV